MMYLIIILILEAAVKSDSVALFSVSNKSWYESLQENCGVMKIFVEAVVKDAIIYATHCNRKTVTAMDVIYTLKCHR